MTKELAEYFNGSIEESLVKYFENYERKHGEITVPEIYRNI